MVIILFHVFVDSHFIDTESHVPQWEVQMQQYAEFKERHDRRYLKVQAQLTTSSQVRTRLLRDVIGVLLVERESFFCQIQWETRKARSKCGFKSGLCSNIISTRFRPINAFSLHNKRSSPQLPFSLHWPFGSPRQLAYLVFCRFIKCHVRKYPAPRY